MRQTAVEYMFHALYLVGRNIYKVRILISCMPCKK